MALTRIAIVGAGKGGFELLKVLLGSRKVQVKHVCDLDPNAKGVLLAKQHGIPYVHHFSEILTDKNVDLIFESTGKTEVLEELRRQKRPGVSIIGSGGTRIIFELLGRYNEANRNLQSYQVNLERRILESTEQLEKLYAELSKEKITAEQLYEQQHQISEERGKYLRYTTHQLKAPFAAIQNYIQVVLDGYTGGVNDETREVMLKIRMRCELLSKTIIDMLELAKLKAQAVDLTREDFDLRDVIAEVVGRFGAAAALKSIEMHIDAPPSPVICHTVRKQLFDLLSALVDNAIRYSLPWQDIVVMAAQHDSKHVITVKDRGIGIAKEHRQRIFDEFFRANNAVRAEPNGSGLGLAIAKEIAHLLDVTIDVESTVGQGSTFRVMIPAV